MWSSFTGGLLFFFLYLNDRVHHTAKTTNSYVTLFTFQINEVCFMGFLFSVCLCHSGFSSPPQRPITSDFEGFLYQILSITLFSYLNSWERASSFPFLLLSAKQGNYWYHFVTSLVWRGPRPGIEPRTSRTRSHHSTTRLSRRRYKWWWY